MSFNVSSNLSWFIQTEQLPIQPLSDTALLNNHFSVTVYPEWYKQVSVEWSIPADWGSCVFDVYFAQTEGGPFNKLNATPIDGTFLIDTTTQEYSKFHNGFYIVEAILLDKNNVTLRSKPATWNNKQRRWVELRSIEVQRREFWLLSKFAGIKSYLFRRKQYGKRCSSCWDTVTEKVMKDRCPVCIGTSFEGGYFDPAPMYMQYETTPNERVKTYFGNLESNQIGSWTISLPEITPDDIVVRTDNWMIYKVTRIVPTELQGNTVRQMCTLTAIAKGDIEYQLISRNLPEFPTQYF